MRRIIVAALSMQFQFLALSAASAETPSTWYLAAIGGADFAQRSEAQCAPARNMVGLDLFTDSKTSAHVGIWAARPVCAMALSPAEIGPLEAASILGRTYGEMNHTRLLCPAERPFVIGAYVNADIAASSQTIGGPGGFEWRVNSVYLYCGRAGYENLSPFDAADAAPDAVFDGQSHLPRRTIDRIATQLCPSELVVVGAYGWSEDAWIHALGFICDKPEVTAKKVGRLKKLDPVGQTAARRLPGVGATAFCESYAAAAVSAATENRDRGCGGAGGRWTMDRDAHFNWCVGHNSDRTIPNEETAARAAALAACRRSQDQ